MSSISDSLDFVKKESLSCIPVPFREKAATIKWQVYQQRKPLDSEIKAWFGNSHRTNLAIVCGAVSDNLVVLDCDTVEKFYELSAFICEKRGINEILDWTTIVRTSKGFHVYLKTDEVVKSAKFPKLDIKGEGGYVIGPGSIHPSGSTYSFANEIFNPGIRHITSLKEIGIDINQKVPEQTNQPGWVSELLRGVGRGSRNDAGAKLVGYFRKSLLDNLCQFRNSHRFHKNL